MRDKLQKLMSYLMLFVMLFNNPATIIFANAAEQTVTPSVKVGIDKNQNYFDADNKQTLDEGDLVVTKSVETINAEEGKYRVKFQLTGKETTESVARPLYSVVVLDTSDSMTRPMDKIKDAHDALLAYSDKLYNGVNQFALVTFDAKSGENAYPNHKGRYRFETSKFSNSELPGHGDTHAGTRYMLGLNEAKKIIENAKNSGQIGENDKVVIVFISDGSPEDLGVLFDDYIPSNTSPTASYRPSPELTAVKNVADEIYTIGYDLNSEANAIRNQAVLRNISSDLMNNFFEADINGLESVVEDLANDLLVSPAATNIKIKEVAAEHFSVTGADEKSIEIDGDTISFDLQIDPTTDNGIYPTNNIDTTTITYTGVDGEEHVVPINETPTIDWERPKYNYTVNYFFGGVQDTSLTTTASGYLTTEIPYNTGITSHKGYVYNHIENYNNETVNSVSVSQDSNKNIVNVYYEKKTNIDYNVYYHYQDVNNEDAYTEEGDTNNSFKATFEDVITADTTKPETEKSFKETGLKDGFTYSHSSSSTENSSDLTIDDTDSNRLDLYYTRNDYGYCIKYFYEEVEDTTAKVEGTAKYQQTISYSDKPREGYRLDRLNPTSGSISINVVGDNQTPEDVNLIEVYYVKDDFGYTVNYYYDNGTTTTKIGNTVTNSAEFDSTVDISDILMDRVPDGYTTKADQKTTLKITANVADNNIDIIYVKDNIGYTVNYYKDSKSNTNKLGETVEGTAEFESTVTLTQEDLEKEIIPGYKVKVDQANTITITANAANNNLDVIYEKADIGYTVNYYKDSKSDENKLGETVEGTAEFDSTVTLTQEDLEKELIPGYKVKEDQGNTITITANATNNNLDVIYVKKDDLQYNVYYHYQDLDDENVYNEETDSNSPFTATFEDVITADTTKPETEKSFKETGLKDGFTYSHSSSSTDNSADLTIADTDNNRLDLYYTRNNYGYCIKYFYAEVEDTDAKVEGTAKYQQTISYSDKPREGYKLDRLNPTSGEISINVVGDNQTPEDVNLIEVYYVKDDFGYTVNYYKDSKSDENKLGETVEGTAEFESTVTLTTEDLEKELIPGYKVKEDQGNTITITANAANNNLDVIYEKAEVGYKVEYYIDGDKDDDLTEELTATFQDVISKYPDKKPTGYKEERVEGAPLTISADEKENIISVFYVKDEFNYNIKYFYDEVEDTSKEVKDVKALYGDTISYEDKNITGYVLDRTDPKEGTITISSNPENNILKVYYKKGQFDYTVEYYYEGTKDDSKTETKTATYKDVISSYTDKNIDGYKFDKVENSPLTITENAKNNVIKVYYVKDKFDYIVEYYVDDEVIQEVIDKETFEEEVTYDPLDQDGLELIGTDPENGILKISSDPSKNIIRVYYKSVTKEEPIEIPNTMVDGPKDYTLLYLFILLNLMLSSVYVTRKNN